MPQTYLQRLQGTAERRDASLISAVSTYQNNLFPVVQQSIGRIWALVNAGLEISPDGTIPNTPGNQRLLRSLDRRFMAFMREAGYDGLNEAFVQRFDGQLPYFFETIDHLSEHMRRELPRPQFNERDLRAFAGIKASTITQLENQIWLAGARAVQKATFAIGGLPKNSLTEVIAKEFSRPISEAEGIAVTGMSTYYRTIAARGAEIVEEDLLGDEEIAYTYLGPLDRLNRPFCLEKVRQAKQGRVWSREQIGRMNNGTSLSTNVFIVCGGWRCRHQWGMVIRRKQRRK